PYTLIGARKGSPLVIGVGDNEYILASDATPIVEYTKNVVYLGEEEIAVMTVRPDAEPQLRVTNLKNVRKTPLVQTLETNLEELEKGGYPHFMLKEIYEQPKVIRDSFRGRINVERNTVALSGIIDHQKEFLNARRIIITACGTSWHAGLVGKYLIEELARIPVEVEYASEYRYRHPIINPDDVIIAISQSGETADTLAAVNLARDHGAFVYGICNVVGASIPRATHSGTYIHAGPEIGVASTKAFTAQVCVLVLVALSLAKAKGTVTDSRFRAIINELYTLPDKIEKTLLQNERIADFSKIFTYSRNFLYLGRGYNYPLALEGALKLKEISYIHAEGYPAAEMKHGPIALVDNEMPIVVIATNQGNYEKIVSNIQEVKARKGRIISIVTEGDTTVKALSDYYIEIPPTEAMLVPILACVPLQLLAYHIAVQRGCNVDQPRNLAKSVTVE
ncbi:MAG: glutamine--fructose-6-phosphate transaminase (isomerizing), partial [Bacteroidales bacterium]|nr:glutamine--fructose-6-phosphate transaminase (isomerizing) [Bacteroidales bacterium]